MTGRYLGVDLGTRRIGLAIGEAESGIASPLAVLDARPTAEANARAILEAAGEYDATGIVVGLPLNMDGTEGPQAKLSKTLAAMMRKLIASAAAEVTRSPQGISPGSKRGEGIQVFLHDERLTSFAADQQLIERNLTRKKKKARQDALAAAILLQSFLEKRRE